MAQYNHHIHPQLTAHSQLTTLSSEQLQYLHLPGSLGSSFGGNHARKDLDGGGKCFICLETIPARTSRNGGNTSDIFAMACQFLEVPVDEGQNEMGLLCMVCSKAVKELMTLKEQIAEIQRRIDLGVSNLRTTIQNTNGKAPVSDSRAINFRFRALRGNIAIIANPSHVAASTLSNTGAFQPQHQSISSTPVHLASVNSITETCPSSSAQGWKFHHSIFSSNVDNNSSAPSINADDDASGYLDDASVNDNHSDFDTNSNSFPAEDYATSHPAANGPALTSSTPRRNKIVLSSSRIRSRQPQGSRSSREDFAPIHTDRHGRMTYEGYEIKATPTGYICVQCGSKWGKQNDSVAQRKVKIHIKGIHLKAYKCPRCDKNFSSQDIVNQHIARSHEGLGGEACDVCGRSVSVFMMKHHKFTHMNKQEKAAYIAAGYKPYSKDTERKYACSHCDLRFYRKSRLRNHERTHIDVNLRKTKKCDQCDMLFATDDGLRNHINRQHTDKTSLRKYMCRICGRMFFDKSSHTLHLKRHVAKEDRPFVCKVCGVRFALAKGLAHHEKTHTGKEVYVRECDICGRKFQSVDSLKQHRRRAHRNHWKIGVPAALTKDFTLDKPGEFGYLEDLNNEGLQHVQGDVFSYQMYELTRIGSPVVTGYRCCTCQVELIGEGDQLEEDVKIHVKLVHIGNLRCNLCTKRMKNVAEVIAHKKKEHMDTKNIVLTCEICTKPNMTVKVFKCHTWSHKNPLEIAEAVNNGESLSDKIYKKTILLENVFKELGEPLSFRCNLCEEESFEGVLELYNHRRSEHPDAPRKLTRTPARRPAPQGPFFCPKQFCKKQLKNKKSLGNHLLRVHKIRKLPTKPKVQQQETSKKASASKQEEVVKKPNKKMIPCEICKRPTTLKMYKRHVWTHKNSFDVADAINKGETILKELYLKRLLEMEQIYREMDSLVLGCAVCGKNFGGAMELHAHRKSDHPEATRAVRRVYRPVSILPKGPVECPECGKTYKSTRILRKHLPLMHKITAKLTTLNIKPSNKRASREADTHETEESDSEEDDTSQSDTEEDEDEENSMEAKICCCSCGIELDGDGDIIKCENTADFQCTDCASRREETEETNLASRNEDNPTNSRLLTCEVCKKPNITVKCYKGHLWTHRSPFDVADAMNKGEVLLPRYVRRVLVFQNVYREMGDTLSLKCGVCMKTFADVMELDKHRKDEHPDAASFVKKIRRLPPRPKPQGPFDCSVCGKLYKSRKNLYDHQRKYHDMTRARRGRPPKSVKRTKMEFYNEATSSEESEPDSDREENNSEDSNWSKAKIAASASTRVSLGTRKSPRISVKPKDLATYREIQTRSVRILVNRISPPRKYDSVQVKVEGDQVDEDFQDVESVTSPNEEFKNSPQSVTDDEFDEFDGSSFD